MASIFQKALSMITGEEPSTPAFKVPKKIRPLRKLTERQLIQLESEIGGKLFGPIPEGGRREFFNLDEKTWIWYEQWLDEAGISHSTTTRYELQDDRILKAQDGAQYSYLEGAELENFGVAVQMYYEQVMRSVYSRDPYSGHKLG